MRWRARHSAHCTTVSTYHDNIVIVKSFGHDNLISWQFTSIGTLTSIFFPPFLGHCKISWRPMSELALENIKRNQLSCHLLKKTVLTSGQKWYRVPLNGNCMLAECCFSLQLSNESIFPHFFLTICLKQYGNCGWLYQMCWIKRFYTQIIQPRTHILKFLYMFWCFRSSTLS